ncbi:MAG: DUF2213 domain-containing protein [Rhizorhabdus sp.]
MQFRDTLTLDAPKRTKDGFLAVRARAARTGVYEYAGAELDPDNAHNLRDMPVVKVLRDDGVVFDANSARSFIGKPVTDDHPTEAVTSENWREHARGTVMGAIRDGEYLAFDLLLTDAAAISKVEKGKRELSNGYSADLEFGSFTAADGTVCQARQTSIAGNHVALVDKGRAGSACAIKDAQCSRIDLRDISSTLEHEVYDLLNPTTPKEKERHMPHTLIVDGLQVPNVSDEAKTAIEKLLGSVQSLTDAASQTQAAHDKALGLKDAEIADMKAKVLSDSQIDALIDAKAEVTAKVNSVLGDALGNLKGKSVADIRRMAVAKKFGDAAVADKSDDYVEARFDAMTADAPKAPLFNHSPITVVTDNAAVRDFVRSAQF